MKRVIPVHLHADRPPHQRVRELVQEHRTEEGQGGDQADGDLDDPDLPAGGRRTPEKVS